MITAATVRSKPATPPTESVGIVHPLDAPVAELTQERYDAVVARDRELPSTRSSSLGGGRGRRPRRVG